MKRLLHFLLLIQLLHPATTIAQATSFPFRDTSLSFEQRVNDLVSRLTLEEKVAQMLNAAPSIDRLGIPAYDWWNEVLHGVARTPYRTTVYPQAIAMAATFDTAAISLMAHYAALEGRAVYNRAVAEGKSGQRYLGLTYWTPNINIFRDPRWGRGQETYGEDPFLTAGIGKAFVRGLQGDHPKYLKAAACAKHYALHSGPEPLRHVFNVNPQPYDLWNTYLPAFEELVTKTGVAGVMCAYNAYKGQPCCGSDELMVDILRKRWNFKGYVTSDCWAIDDFFKNHKTHPDAATAAADAVWHGTDIDCGTDAYKALVQAVQRGLINESQIDISLKRLFTIRFQLGMFDPPSVVPYAAAGKELLEHADHQAHALKLARESIVLLRNEGILPLQKQKMRKIAVVGPNADNAIAVLGNYNGIPSEIITPLEGIRNKLGKNVDVVYEKAISFTNDTVFVAADLDAAFTWNGKPGFEAQYFTNEKLEGNAIHTQQETLPDHLWQEGQQVVANLKAYHFSVRYRTVFRPVQSMQLSFEVDADDGYKLLVDGKEVINAWTRNRWGARIHTMQVEGGKTYPIELQYFQSEGKAHVRLSAGQLRKTDFEALADKVKDADAIIFVGGISPQLEGEEMKVDEPGFSGGDRTSILLPEVQTRLMKTLKATGKPLVFVMMTGSAIATPWESKSVPAIINSWYGGQAAGTAVADVLFGDYNPSGKLPLTFYAADSDLPDFNDYSMKNRTYRYFTGEPLYRFGHGLSYTKFEYSNLVLPTLPREGEAAVVTVTVKNVGPYDGEDVAQLYVSGTMSAAGLIRSLRGFQRVALKAGESKQLRFELRREDLSTYSETGMLQIMKGPLRIAVGSGQPSPGDNKTKATIEGTIQNPKP